MFVPHALLLRGTLYSLWREDGKALKDLQEVVNTQEQDKQVNGHFMSCIIYSPFLKLPTQTQSGHYRDFGVTVNIKAYLWLLKLHQKETVFIRAVLCHSSVLQ